MNVGNRHVSPLSPHLNIQSECRLSLSQYPGQVVLWSCAEPGHISGQDQDRKLPQGYNDKGSIDKVDQGEQKPSLETPERSGERIL